MLAWRLKIRSAGRSVAPSGAPSLGEGLFSSVKLLASDSHRTRFSTEEESDPYSVAYYVMYQ